MLHLQKIRFLWFFQVTIAVLIGLTFALSAYCQDSPEDHAKHHPSSQSKEGAPAGDEMGGMMSMMGVPPKKELYPTLMELPKLSPEKKMEVQRQAHERMHSGVEHLSQGLVQLSKAIAAEDYKMMQKAVFQVHEGLAIFESSLSVDRALAEGKAPKNVALQWFNREMNMEHPIGPKFGPGIFGLSWFHLFVMTLLTSFAVAMIGMYFLKMRRAALLLNALTGGAPSRPATEGMDMTFLGTRPDTQTIAHEPSRKWSGRLRVGRIFQETPNVKTFRLTNPLGGMMPFSYLPGQFLAVTVAPPEGQSLRRSYTIASSPTQRDYAEITVKHEEGGVVSGYLHHQVKEGDFLDVIAPAGSYTFTGRAANSIVLIGGGVGITPLMSVARYLIDRTWTRDIFFLYGCPSPADFIFREELEYLQRRHPNFHLVATVTRVDGTDWKGPTGWITKELIAQSVPDIATRLVHICGPVAMMETVKKMLAELGVPQEQIKTEAFGATLGKPEPVEQIMPPLEESYAGVALPTLTFSRSGRSALLPPDKSILDVADKVGVEIDNFCRSGTCGTCKIKLLSGTVTMAIEEALGPNEKAQGTILACQAKSKGNVVVEA